MPNINNRKKTDNLFIDKSTISIYQNDSILNPVILKNYLINSALALFAVKKVRKSVTKYHGKVNFAFSQVQTDFFKEIIKHKQTSAGICDALTSYWIALHAQGKNLFKEIITGDENKLNKNKIFEIKKLQVDFNNYEESFLAHKNWLNSQGLDYKKFYKDDGYFKNKGTKNKYQRSENTDEAIKNLAESIVSTPSHNKDGEYKKIALHGSMLGHSVSAYINKNTVIYFDPNFGEFEFNKKNDFIEWFVDKYWSKSLYKNTLNKKFFVDHFEKINTVKAEPSKKFSTNNVRKTHTDRVVHHNTLASTTTTASDTHHAVKNTDVEDWETPEVTTKTDGGSTDYDGHLIIQMENDAIVAKAAADLAGKHHDSVLVQLDSDGYYHLIHGDTTQLRDKMNLRVQVVAHSREGGAAVNNLTFAGQTHPELATTLNRFLDEFKHDHNVEIKPSRVVLAGCSLAGPNKQNDFADGLIRGLNLETVSVTAYTDELGVADNGHRFIVDNQSNVHDARQGKIIYHKDQQQGVRVEIKADEPTKLDWIMQLLNQLADETQTVPSLGMAERTLLREAFHLSDGQLDIQRVLLTAHHPERRQTWYEGNWERLQKLVTHSEQASLGIQERQFSLEQPQAHQQQKQRALAFYEAIKNTQKAHPGITVDMKLMSPTYFLRQGIDTHKDSHAWSLAFLDAKQSGEKYDIFSSGLSADALRRQKIIDGSASGSEIAYAHHLDNQFKELKNRTEIEVNNKAIFTPSVQDLFDMTPTPGAYLLKGDHHSITLNIKQKKSGSHTYSLYDPQVGNVDLTPTSSEGGDALYHLLDHYLQGKDKDGRTRAQQYGFEKMGNKYAFNAYQVNIEQARKQIHQLETFQTSLDHQLATDRLSSHVTLFDDVRLPFKTLLDMGVTFEGRVVTVGQQINRIDADSLKEVRFRPQQLYDFLTKNNLDHPDFEPALRLIKKRMGAIDGNSSSLIARELTEDQKIAKKTLTLLDKVNQHTELNPDGTVTIKNKLMRSLQPKNLMHRINKGANYAGPGMSVLGYYFGYRAIDSYNNALKQEGLTPEQRQALESERDFAVISVGLNAGVDIGQYGMSKMASFTIKNNAMKSVGQIGSKMRLIKVGGVALSMVGVGLDVYSAYQSFSKLDTETDPDIRQDLIVSGSLSVAGAVVGIGVTGAFIVGGSAAAAAGPLGLVIGGVLLAGGQIYSAVRQVEEIEKQIYLSVGDKWETGWRAFWMLPPSKEIQDRLANTQSQLEMYREMCNIFLENNAMKMLTEQGLKTVYRYVYSLKDFDLKPEKYSKLYGSLPFVGLIEIKEGSILNPGKIKKEDLEKSKNELKEKLEKHYGKDWETTYHRFKFIETNEYYYTPIFKEVDDVFDPADPESTKNATSLDNLDNAKADGSVIFNLGDGNDQATGYRRRSNTFFGGKGAKKYTGRSLNDLFYLGNNTQDSSRGDFIGSEFDGQDGEDTLVIQATPVGIEGYFVDLKNGYISYHENWVDIGLVATMTGIEHVIAKRFNFSYNIKN
ncbi:C80 family cysteine peptidase [Candidatus Williamhamiltonella defendens]|uniref:C80 family cysteine peptidase n=1 Tax=Candidatus Williamhamiltonella defendens TaxID=138072 RepID=UPI0015826995|nr:C80 family cysteine peptidase [Candidatus Hamiltonella defensa]